MIFRFAILTLFVITCIAENNLWAQVDSTRLNPLLQIELNGHVGRLVKIHGEYPKNDISSIVECNINWKLRGSKSWHKTYNSPSAGLSLIHAQFGNQDVLGQAMAVIPTIRFERWKNETMWSWRAGMGFAAFNKPYDEFENPGNLVIGSAITNMSMLRLEMSKPLGKKIRYSLGCSFTHCSDGHIAVPNIGANLIAVSAGFSWSKDNRELSLYSFRKEKPYSVHPWLVGVSLLGGIHEFNGTVKPVNGPRYYVLGENIFISKELRNNRILSVGINHHYYQAYSAFIRSQELFPSGDHNKLKSHTVILYAGYEWRYGKIALFLQGGINLYAPFLHAFNKVWDLPKHGLLYLYTANKIGYRYYPLENSLINPFISLGIKTNGGTADFIELAVGFFIHKKREQVVPVSE